MTDYGVPLGHGEAVRLFLSDPSTPQPTPPDGFSRRVLDAGRGLVNLDPRCGVADFTALVRQFLLNMSAREGNRYEVPVPREAAGRWPERPDWEASGIGVRGAGDRYRLAAEPWQPEWCADALDSPSGEFGIGAKRRRSEVPEPVDPFVPAMLGAGFHTYYSHAQKQALRSVLSAPAGSTLIVSLPTGSGKSLLANVPALVDRTGLSVVVVPTIALALDQERAMSSISAQGPPRYAYTSDLSAIEKTEFKDRIRGGSQPIVYTSPEALMRSLLPVLYEVAASGRLRQFTIDEAHLVGQWGAEFRPEFQSMAGVRSDLLRLARESGRDPFVTLLMSATLSESSVGVLRALFGDPGPTFELRSDLLRPEPGYWFIRCTSQELRAEQVVEAMRYLPRPAIVYTATRNDASNLVAGLREGGFRRVAEFTGATEGEVRRDVIDRFRCEGDAGSGIDVVVGTSAFGLGVDQADVRTVVHACVPETIDRFYQEVGRGGRDGWASTSLVLWTPDDLEVAKSLNEAKIIGVEKGSARWRAMVETGEQLGSGDRIRVHLDAQPPHLARTNETSRKWNIRTLALMARARLVQLDSEPPPQREDGEDTESWEARAEAEFDRYRETVVVRMLRGDVGLRRVWEEEVEPLRQSEMEQNRTGLRLMRRALDGEAVCDLLVRAYAGPRTLPEKSCGGCDVCRHRAPRSGLPPWMDPISESRFLLDASLQSLIGHDRRLWVTYERPSTRAEERGLLRHLDDLVNALVRRGVRLICGPRQMTDRAATQKSFKLTPDRALFVETLDGPHSYLDKVLYLPRVPTLLLLGHEESDVLPGGWTLPPEGFPLFLVLPSDTVLGPARIPFQELCHPIVSSDVLLRRL